MKCGLNADHFNILVHMQTKSVIADLYPRLKNIISMNILFSAATNSKSLSRIQAGAEISLLSGSAESPRLSQLCSAMCQKFCAVCYLDYQA